MRLLIVRHAIAEDRVAFAATGKDDDERPLTEEGRSRMEQGARGLRQLVPALDLVATSPLVRAVQTAEILAGAYEGVAIEQVGIPQTGDHRHVAVHEDDVVAESLGVAGELEECFEGEAVPAEGDPDLQPRTP